jgi:hypothetical protein
MKFRARVEPNEHSWRSRVAIMRGCCLLGLTRANREAAGVVTGEGVEIELAFDPEPPAVNVPEDFARALDADPAARAAYDRLTHSRKREHVRAIESAKKRETRIRRIEKALATLTALSRWPTLARREEVPTCVSHWLGSDTQGHATSRSLM